MIVRFLIYGIVFALTSLIVSLLCLLYFELKFLTLGIVFGCGMTIIIKYIGVIEFLVFVIYMILFKKNRVTEKSRIKVESFISN